MEELRMALDLLLSEGLSEIIISNPRQKEGTVKVKIRPVLLKEQLMFQVTRFRGKQVFHENLDREQAKEEIEVLLTEDFRQLEGENRGKKLLVLVSKKGKMTVKWTGKQTKMQPATAVQALSHNRKKKYLLEEGIPVPFLVDLGVQTIDGRIVHARYDKFRQINRYLEFVEDILPVFSKDECIHIIDFGCGKSYLTFALYYYLHEKKGYQIAITGLDLKEDVIDHCSALAEKYGYEALQKAVDWGARVILSVPCCQHEVNKQIRNEALAPVLKYGLIRERMSALLTDAIRADLLEEHGYDTQILEFIDMEHTPKNILIRAVKGRGKKDTGIQRLTEELQVHTTLQKLFEQTES